MNDVSDTKTLDPHSLTAGRFYYARVRPEWRDSDDPDGLCIVFVAGSPGFLRIAHCDRYGLSSGDSFDFLAPVPSLSEWISARDLRADILNGATG